MQATQNSQSATKKVVQPGSACAYGWTSLFFVILAISGVIVVSVAPICSRPTISTGFFIGYWRPPAYCEAGLQLGITNICFACIWAPLTLAGLSTLSNKTPVEANDTQFSCIFIWALVLCGSTVFLAFWEAMVVTLSSSSGYYSCPWWYSSSSSIYCSPEFQAWIVTAERASRPHKAYLTFVVWTWLCYTIAGVVVPSRTKYWCCPDCKRSCPQTTPEDDCNTCVCCLGEVPAKPIPQQPVAVVGAVAMTGQPVALVAGQPMQMQMQPQMTEVQYWLTYEIGLPNYAPIFIQQGYTHMQSLLYNINTEQDLRRIVPTVEAGHVGLMLNNLNAKRQAAQGYMANTAAPPAGGYAMPPQQYGAPVGYEGGMTQQQQT